MEINMGGVYAIIELSVLAYEDGSDAYVRLHRVFTTREEAQKAFRECRNSEERDARYTTWTRFRLQTGVELPSTEGPGLGKEFLALWQSPRRKVYVSDGAG